MTSNLDTEGDSPAEFRRRRTFRTRVWVGIGFLLLSNLALFEWGGRATAGQWRAAWAVLPLVPLAWLVVVIVLRARELDEYQVRLLFPGLAVGFTVAMVAAITLGTLNSAGIDVPNAAWPVALAGMFGWQITNLVVGAPKA